MNPVAATTAVLQIDLNTLSLISVLGSIAGIIISILAIAISIWFYIGSNRI